MDRGAWWTTVHGVPKSWTWVTNTNTFLVLVTESRSWPDWDQVSTWEWGEVRLLEVCSIGGPGWLAESPLSSCTWHIWYRSENYLGNFQSDFIQHTSGLPYWLLNTVMALAAQKYCKLETTSQEVEVKELGIQREFFWKGQRPGVWYPW